MEVFKVAKKDVKTKGKQQKNTKKENYIKGVRKELKLVKWPTIGEVVKYTIATIIFCVILVFFFILLNLFMSWIKGMFV